MIEQIKIEHLKLDYFLEFGCSDKDFIKESLEIFIEDGILYRNQLNKALEENNLENVRQLAHKFKSTLKVFELNGLFQFLDLLETQTTKTLDQPNFSVRFKEFKHNHQKVLVEAQDLHSQFSK